MPLEIATPSALSAEQLAAVRSLIADVAEADGREPLSDQALSHLESPDIEHVLAVVGADVVGYAQLSDDSLEIAARPDAIDALVTRFAGRPVLVWSHGHNSRLAAALPAYGFTRARELHQLRRSLIDPVPVPDVPDGVRLSTFTVGQDEDAWVQVNAAAFADHPEQGRWTRADLEAREHEEWFDPGGFLLAWRGAQLVGFHWTKVHPDGTGEVYVIGVDPSAQGLGLGVVLFLHGLDSLRARGCSEVLLYVDDSNSGAMHLYERYGFGPHDLDIQWRSPAGQSGTGRVSNT